MAKKQPARKQPEDHYQSRQNLTAVVIRLMVLGFVLLMIATVIFLVWFKPGSAEAPRSAELPKDFNTLMRDGTPNQLREFSINLISDIAGQSLLARIERLNRRIQIADSLVKKSSDPDLLEFATVSKLDSLVMLNEANLSNDLPRESIREQLIALADSSTRSKSDLVRRKANMALLVMRATEFNHDPANFEACKQQIIESSNAMTSDLISARAFRRLVTFLENSKDEEKKIVLKKLVAETLFASSVPEIKLIGEQANEQILEAKHNFENLVNELEFASGDWPKRVEEFIFDFENTQGISVKMYSMALLLVESLLRVEQDDLAVEYFARLKKASEQIQDKDRRDKVDELLGSHSDRMRMVGKPFLISGHDVFGNPLDAAQFKGKVTTILFYSSAAKRSVTYLSSLHELKYLHAEGARFLCIGIDLDDREQVKPMADKYPQLIWANAVDTQEMVKIFPLSFSPYLVLLDQEGKVVRINVGLDYLRNSILGLLDN